MQEFGMEKYLHEDSIDQWLKFPLSGVRQAANDMVEATRDIKSNELLELDSKLIAKNLPTITNMRQSGFKKLLKILSKGNVKNEDEWRLLRSFSENDTLSKDELVKIQELLNEYEFQST